MQEQAARIRSYFDAAADEYARRREREFSFATQKRIALEILPARLERVLDAGCGPAVMAPDLLERADEYWGTALSEQRIAAGRALAGAGFQNLEERYCNFIFHPLHELHAGASLVINRRLTALGQPPLARWLGSQYIVKVLRPR